MNIKDYLFRNIIQNSNSDYYINYIKNYFTSDNFNGNYIKFIIILILIILIVVIIILFFGKTLFGIILLNILIYLIMIINKL
jgi:hypothetical protein